jgi:exo-beta-1,3-glucanase (GH17 family)
MLRSIPLAVMVSVAAIQAIASPPAPTALTADSSNGIVLTWNAVAEADHYEVVRRAAGGSYATIATPATNRFADGTASLNTPYAYKVRAIDAMSAASSDSDVVIAMSSSFTDDPPVPRLTAIKVTHVTQLRMSIAQLRNLAGLGSASWSPTAASGSVVKASHLTEMRTALDGARTALSMPAASYTNTLTAGITPIRAIDIAELRNRAVGRIGGNVADPFWSPVAALTSVQAILTALPNVFAGTASGVYRSANGGDSWIAVNTGLTNLNVKSLAVAADGALFAGTAGDGVFQSLNNGDMWTLRSATPANATTLIATSAGVFAADGTNCSGIFLLPSDGSAAVSRGGGVSGCTTALAASSTNLFAATATTGVYRSANNGQSWDNITGAITSTNIHALAADRDNRIFAATHDAGVWRSSDEGTTWARVQNGLTPSDVRTLNAEYDGDLLAASETGATIFRTSDNGTSWSAASAGLPAASQAVTALGENGRYRFAAVDGRLYRSAGGFRMYGIDFGPYIGANEAPGTVLTDEQLVARMKTVQPYTKWIRNFSMVNGLEKCGRIAHALGLKAALNAYITNDAAANQREMDNLVAAALNGDADLIIVGSEALFIGVPESTLIAAINSVKQRLPGRQVATAEIYGDLLNHPNVIAAADIIMPNIYPFWENVAVDKAILRMQSARQQIVSAAGGKPVIISETGWPSDGTHAVSVPSLANAIFYFQDFQSWARANRVDAFYFAAFDEPWKSGEGDVGTHWGVWQSNQQLKSGFDAAIAGERMSDNWSGTQVVGGPGAPQISFTAVPPIHSTTDDLLHGQVSHVAPASYRVAVYIFVGGGWWTKPTFANPTTTIDPDGTWVCDIVTGGNDQDATKIHAFLIASDYTPPQGNGQPSLPDLTGHEFAELEVTR